MPANPDFEQRRWRSIRCARSASWSTIPPERLLREPFDIFYLVRNHTDAMKYYVRGAVYD
jgi:hypothetical protein